MRIRALRILLIGYPGHRADSDRQPLQNTHDDGYNSDAATTEEKVIPQKSTSTPTKRSKPIFKYNSGTQSKHKIRAQGRKPTSKARSANDKAQASNSSSSKDATNKLSTTEPDEDVPVIDYMALEMTTPIQVKPLTSKKVTKRRERYNEMKYKDREPFWEEYRHRRSNELIVTDTSASPMLPKLSSDATNRKDGDEKYADVQIVAAENIDAVVNNPMPSFHRRTPNEPTAPSSSPIKEPSRGEPSFRRGGKGPGRGNFRGGYRGKSRPGFKERSHPIDSSNIEEKLAENVSQLTLAPQSEEQEDGQQSGDRNEAEQAKWDAKREAKREKMKKRRQAKRQSVRIVEQQPEGKISSQEQTAIPEGRTSQETSNITKKPLRPRPFPKRPAKFKEGAHTSASFQQSATGELNPSPDTTANSLKVDTNSPVVVSPFNVENTIANIVDKPRRQKKFNKREIINKTAPQPVANDHIRPIANDHIQPIANDHIQNPAKSPAYENQSSVKSMPTFQMGHHKPNFKRDMSLQEDNARPIHTRNDVPVPMVQPMPASVSTPSFVSQPVAYALTAPNGGPIPVYTMPFPPPMNPALGDVQGGRQGMYYAPMMASAATAVSTPNAAPMAPPTMVDPNNVMYMPYDSPQMMMYSPYWYQPVNMTQQGLPPPNQQGWSQPSDYNNNWKPPVPDQGQIEPNYTSSTAPGVQYNQHGEQMPYPHDNINGQQPVYYYPVSY